MIVRHTKSDPKQAVRIRPRVEAVRIGRTSTTRPRTITDYAYKRPFVSNIARHSSCPLLSD